MGEAAEATVTVQQDRIFHALGQLAIAYFDRMSVSDYPRAGVVLSVFSDTFNANRPELVAALQARAPATVSHLPAQLQPFFDTAGGSVPENQPNWRMREILELSLVTLGMSASSMRTMPQVAVSLGPWWMGGTRAQVEQRLPTEFELSRTVTGLSMQNINQLSSLVRDAIATGAITSSTPPAPAPSPSPTVPTPAPRDSTQGGDITFNVPGTRAGFAMPVWGWWAIGIGVVAAAGVVTWGIVDQGWLESSKPKARSSGRSRRRRRRR